jgi:hypothetical protein
MSDFEYEYEVLTSVDTDLAAEDYLRRRDVRMVVFVEGLGRGRAALPEGQSGRAVWLALRDNGDFEVSDTFSAAASAEVSRYHREQAYQAVRLGKAVTVAEAEQAVADAKAAAAAKAKPKKSKAKVTA